MKNDAPQVVIFPLLCFKGCGGVEQRPQEMIIAVSELCIQSHLKTDMNASFPLIDLTEHSGQLAEMLAAPMDCCLPIGALVFKI